MQLTTTAETAVRVTSLAGRDLADRLAHLGAYACRAPQVPLSRVPSWLTVLADGLRHTAFCVEAVQDGRTCGVLPLAYVRSFLFGRFLVSLPYLNSAGVLADSPAIACRLIDQAVALADELKVRYLELRHEQPVEHPSLSEQMTDKVHMRLALPARAVQLWDGLPAKVRNQVRKGQKCGLTVAWGGAELLGEFHTVFSRNMRDLGTPSYGRSLFASVLQHFPQQAEVCVVRSGERPVAASLLLHGKGVTEVPSASALREYNLTCANMLLYWQLLERAVRRGQSVFDFGRSSADSNTFRFKKQWGAEPWPATWQYYVRHGNIAAVRPDNPRYGRMIRLWQRLPVALTRLIGPPIVRGIP
jgi:FemAB-related protein (PEP-CTERM system-associated)